MAITHDEAVRFAEDVALYFEQDAGLPRISGRVIGWLLICDPPEQTAGQLAETLQASKASISTSTRQLIQAGLVEKVSAPGDRRTYYRINDSGWVDSVFERLAAVTNILKVLEKGSELLAQDTPARRARLENVADLYRWMQRELPPLLARHREQRLLNGGKK
ncbi:GbsR/MarR family transcriptional regulator [Streptomyces sp. NL15-2K]|uniref:GbsR/MarR family transcriptional regulator n=1 Tax=Streptomyces sp. NL15-2K TaxID=376149 RepID=UPI000F574794|nr:MULTISPECIES: MarR family transcriptional regulator [Actinomycetes]WKX13889.1 MarR family transcriptional regulator [Kutzneria buriramensis]